MEKICAKMILKNFSIKEQIRGKEATSDLSATVERT
jgi:hypothetical protein